jgi:hypothetical protein
MARAPQNFAEIFRNNRELNVDNLADARAFLGDDVLREIANFVPQDGNESFKQKLARYVNRHRDQFSRFVNRNKDAVVNFWDTNKYEIIQRSVVGAVTITGLSFVEVRTMSARMAGINYVQLLNSAIEADAVELLQIINRSVFSKEDKKMIKANLVNFLTKTSDLTNAFNKFYGVIRTPVLGKLDTLGIMQLIGAGAGTLFSPSKEMTILLTTAPFAVAQLKSIVDNVDNVVLLNKLISKQNKYDELKADILRKMRREKGKIKKSKGIKTLTQSQLETKLSKLDINKENEEAIIKTIMDNFTKEQLEQIVLDRGESVPKKISKKELAEFVSFMIRFDAKTIDGKVRLNLG